MPTRPVTSAPAEKPVEKPKLFDSYQIFIIAVISIVHFTVVLDFMVLSPLGAQLMRELDITTTQFGLVVSAYAFSAGASGLLAAGFADKFDRKKILVFFYVGFIIGTFFCGIANTYTLLLIARTFTGVFGGVMGSIGMAIITDHFPMQTRGRVMGLVMMSFSVSQILGIPIALYLAGHYNWQMPFMLIVAMSIVTLIWVLMKMKPVTKHLETKIDKHPIHHLFTTISNRTYMRGFGASALLSLGGFMIMPYSSAFLVENVGIDEVNELPIIFMVSGLFSMVAGPLIGKLSDRFGKFNLFVYGSMLSAIMIVVYTSMGVWPLMLVLLVNVMLMFGITARMISASALLTGLPDLPDRGAFMGVNSSLQQIAGGVASVLGGMIVSRGANGQLQHFDWIGWITLITMIVCAVIFKWIDRYVANRPASSPAIVAVEH
ncbi:MAG TPA: MFS transporter [Candidatus Kapabacteria bacterium]|nr:MFS transporter [Candidatus Kapabacteria bacterium]